MNNKPVSANDIDAILETSSDLEERLLAWQASKEVGKSLKHGLTDLRGLRNATVQALDYEDYFQYQVSDYDMSSESANCHVWTEADGLEDDHQIWICDNGCRYVGTWTTSNPCIKRGEINE